MPELLLWKASPRLTDSRFINSSAARRRIVTALHVHGTLTARELRRETGMRDRRLVRHLRRLEAAVLVTAVCTAPTRNRRALADLYTLA